MTEPTQPGEGKPAVPSELTPDTTVGKYRIEKVAGRGGKGIVYEALDTVLDRKVALKVIRPETITDAKDLDLESQRFLTEARILANLKVP